MDNILVLNYQENIADNFSIYAYGKIIGSKTNKRCCYKNSNVDRSIFEDKMKNFNLNYDYISPTRIEDLKKKNYKISSLYKKDFSIKKEINFTKKYKNYFNMPYFKIDDIDYISQNIIDDLSFKEINFIVNYDLLEDINNNNSIGLYINPKDIEQNNVDWQYIYKATKRLNKYIKQPILYIFLNSDKKINLKSEIEYKILKIQNWQEEFYFQSKCKHKIILNAQNSYSQSLWATLLNDKSYSIKTYSKNISLKTKRKNWLAV